MYSTHPAPVLMDAPTPQSLELHFEVTNPEVVAELLRHGPGAQRQDFAQQALRIGVMALRSASGSLDADVIRHAGSQLMGDVRELLVGESRTMTGQVGDVLTRYLDPQSGSLPQRLQNSPTDPG